jgi:hypothetical protein
LEEAERGERREKLKKKLSKAGSPPTAQARFFLDPSTSPPFVSDYVESCIVY